MKVEVCNISQEKELGSCYSMTANPGNEDCVIQVKAPEKNL